MAFKSLKGFLLIACVALLITNCKNDTKNESTSYQDTISVYNFDDKRQLKSYDALDLDATHPNMLNSNNSKEENEKVTLSWTNLHQDIVNYLAESDFSWNVMDERISILHKFYFNPDGTIKSYFFRTFTDNISIETKNRYAKLVTEFAKTHSIDYTRSTPFAQCGKSVYPN